MRVLYIFFNKNIGLLSILILALYGCMSSSRLTSNYISNGTVVCLVVNKDILSPSKAKLTFDEGGGLILYSGSRGKVINSGSFREHEYGNDYNIRYLIADFGNNITLKFELRSLNFADAYFLSEAKINGITQHYEKSGGLYWYLDFCE